MLADSHPLLNLKPVLHREDEQEDQRGAHRDLHQSLHERHAGGGCAAAPLCHCRGKDRLSHRPVSDVHIWQRPVSYGEPVTSAIGPDRPVTLSPVLRYSGNSGNCVGSP